MTDNLFEIEGLSYSVIGDNKVEVIKSKKDEAEIEIPEKVTHENKEYAVTRIGISIFHQNARIQKLRVSSSIEIIGSYSCYYATGLKEVKIPDDSNIIRFNDHCFDGCVSLDTISLPSRLQYIGIYSLCGVRHSSVHIPKSVNEINYGAFALSPALANFSVEQGNDWFTVYNGSLYSKDMRRFIAANLVSDIWIKDSVEVILDGALSMSIQRVHLPYMLRSLGIIDFGLHETKRIEIIYCCLRRFKSLNVINSANMQIRLITASFSPFKDNFGIKSVGSVESVEFCTIDVMINPFHTCCRRKKLRSVCFMLCSIFSIV